MRAVEFKDNVGTEWEGEQHLLEAEWTSRTAECSDASLPMCPGEGPKMNLLFSINRVIWLQVNY